MYLYEKMALEEKKKHLNDHIKINDSIFSSDSSTPDTRYVSLMTSISHTYGNALAYIQKYILSIFPDNMFRTIHVQSKIAHRQIKSTTHEFIKKNKPMIIFRPRIPSMDEDRFLKGTLLTERQIDIYSTWGNTNLQPFFYDDKNKINIKYQLNRTVMYVDVTVILSTLIQQLDYYQYLQNAVRINHSFDLETCLESYLPEEMLYIISALSGNEIYSTEGTTKAFLQYMNQNSIYPITYKLQGSTRRREFYRYYPAIINVNISDLDKDDGERVGNVMSDYKINFTVRLEFNSNGLYYIFNENIHDIKLPEINVADSSAIIPVFTDIVMKEELQLAQGWSLYNRASFMFDNENENEIEFKELLNASIIETIKYHNENSLPYFDFIDIKLRRQGQPLIYNKDYIIDWDNFKIKINNANRVHTYNINVCINVEYINDLIKKIYNLK